MEQAEYLELELKEVGEDGTFKGIASVYGIEDLGGDVIDRGAFTKTLAENPTVPLLFHHKADQVIGEGEVKEHQGRILLTGRLALDIDEADKAYRLMKRKLIKGLSIGFRAIKTRWEEIEGRMVRHIVELKLYEVSVVTFPMLPQAQVTSVKSSEEIDRLKKENERLATENQALRAAQATPAGAGEGKRAAELEPTEPAADHSGALAIVESMRAHLRSL